MTDRKIVDYTIVTEDTLPTTYNKEWNGFLRDAVNKLISQGYQPFGSPFS